MRLVPLETQSIVLVTIRILLPFDGDLRIALPIAKVVASNCQFTRRQALEILRATLSVLR